MSTLVAQTISNGTISTSSANVIQGSAKAWVNFNGTNGSIRTFYNVSSVSRTGTGAYTINFTNAFPDANYVMTQGVSNDNNVPVANYNGTGSSNTTTSCQILVSNGVGGALDRTVVTFAFFR